MWRLLIVTLAVPSVLLGACAAAPATNRAPASNTVPSLTNAPAAIGPVNVSLKEWTIELSTASAKSGTVTFNARNDGKVPHDLVVLKTDIPANRLQTASGLVDESKVTVVGRTEQLTPGDGKRLSVDMTKGTYVLICNVIGHYNSGQFASFTVE